MLILVVLFFVLTLIHGSAVVPEDGNGKTPAEICADEGAHGKLVPHEVCRMFYMCAYGRPFEYDCHPLVYNPVQEYCDWPENVDCGDRT